jgi:hypothetical protein
LIATLTKGAGEAVQEAAGALSLVQQFFFKLA